MQRAGFEPAKRCVLGPHPSAFDQAGQPLLQQAADQPRIFQHREINLQRKKTEQQVRLASAAEIWVVSM